MSTREIVAPGSTFSGLSRYALDAIRGKWGVTIGAFVLSVVIKGAAQQIPLVGPLFAGYFLIPLDVGVMLFCLKLIRREKTPIECIFDPFSDYWRYLWGGVRVALVVLLWALPLILDGIVMCLLLFAAKADESLEGTLAPFLIFGGVLFPFLFIPAAVACLRYAMTLYIMIDHPEYRAKDAMEESDAITYGHKWQYVGYFLLIGLIFIPVTLFTLGIGLFWFIPWAGVFTASFYESIRRREPDPAALAAEAAAEA